MEVYVGLEHIDPENLRIIRRGSSSDVKCKKLLVQPGQIIFGKRNAYLRKVAVADFSGICSAHAMVLEAIPAAILPEYLPFFMQSDIFMERAISISEGSMSPTIKWKTLANQEFPLPPRSLQEHLVEIMTKIGKVIDVTEAFIYSLQRLNKALENKLFQISDFIKIGDFCNVNTGRTPSKANPTHWGGNINWMLSGEIHNRFITDTAKKITENAVKELKLRLLPKNTVLLAINGQGKTRGNVAITKVPLTCNESLAALICDEKKILPDFLYFYLRTQYQNMRNLTGEGRVGLNTNLVKSIKVPFTDLKQQQIICNLLYNVVNCGESLENKKKQLLQIKRKILKFYLEGVT
ncbi:restriction endonuclease subunit S [Bartonella sp. DGB1]|uniref:restriction endonuclease subunit S n=1 Tax=Bartonella sp. DGB1 TaxID=3239807 RepID=UPI003524A3E8